VTDINLSSHRLDNGLQVTVSSEPEAPGAAVNLWYDVGSADDPVAGFAHLFEHLMFAGSANVADGQHIVILEALGGLANATTNPDRTNYFQTVPTGALELALWLEADRLTSLDVSQTALDTQRAVVMEEKAQRYDNQPYGDQAELMLALVFPDGHPYATPTIGSIEALSAASLADVRSFHQTWYQPTNASLAIVSPQPEDEVLALVDRYFGALPSDQPANHIAMPALPPLTGLVQTKVSRSVPRSVIHLLWRTPPVGHCDQAAVGFVFSILGGGQACRLHRHLVRQRRLAQSITASDFGFARGNSIGGISAQPEAEIDCPALEAAIIEELAELAINGPTDDEMRRVRAQIERDWYASLASIGDRADAINDAVINYGDAAEINRHLDRWLAVSAEDVVRAAAQWLGPENRASLEYAAEVPS